MRICLRSQHKPENNMKKIAALFLLLIYAIGLNLSSVQAQESDKNQSLALTGAKIYTSPTAKPILAGTVLIKDGKIIAVGDSKKIKFPKNTRIIDCKGLVLTAGFWNSHVHFTEDKWANAANLPAVQLAQQMQEMLTRYGFAYVLDTGSFPANTLILRQRIEKENIAGPFIRMAEGSFAAPDGTPFYLEPLKLPELFTPEQATELVNQVLDLGVEGIKIFAASPKRGKPPVVMPLDIAKAVVAAAHARGKFVAAHPTNNDGIEVVIGAGVDILAHTTPDGGQIWNADMVKRLKAAHVALIPTLRLWKYEFDRHNAPAAETAKFMEVALRQLRAYSQAGGEILFGTDVGYMSHYSTADEYELMAKAGMNFQQILASLTTAPAARFGAAKHTGKIAVGMDADIVVLASDPAVDIKALANVKYTLRKGNIIYGAK
jgi:imidazolonepropionase-like amidohydrolase